MKLPKFITLPLLAMATTTSAYAEVIYSDFRNIEIPTDFTGVYLNVETGNTEYSDTSPPADWHINAFFGGMGFTNSPDFQPLRETSVGDGNLSNLSVGSLIGPSATHFATGDGGSQYHLGNTFVAGTEGYIGFSLDHNATTCHGWMRVVFNGTGNAYIKDWAYDTSGNAINVARIEQSAAADGTQQVTLSPGTGESLTLGSAITDTDLNVNSVVMNGLGTVSLSATNTHSGPTTISAGRLFINGSTAGGAVTVDAGATLGGTGVIGGNTTLGDAGHLEFDIATPAAIHDSLDLASGRTLTFSGASVLTITSSSGEAEPGAYTLVSAPGGITGSAPATLNLPDGWQATISFIGNDLVLDLVSTGGVSALYNDWAAVNGITGEAADPAATLQADGMTNFEKFAYGMDPNVANFSPLEFNAQGGLTAPGAPTLINFSQPGNSDDEHAVFTRRKDHAAAGLIYTVHFSADLKQWTASGVVPTVLTDPGSTSDHEVVSVPFADSVPVNGGGAPLPPKFMRVIVSME